MVVLPEVTAVRLHHDAIDTISDCINFSTGWRGNGSCE